MTSNTGICGSVFFAPAEKEMVSLPKEECPNRVSDILCGVCVRSPDGDGVYPVCTVYVYRVDRVDMHTQNNRRDGPERGKQR